MKKNKLIILIMAFSSSVSCKIFQERKPVYTYDYSSISNNDTLIRHMKVLDSVVSRKKKDTFYFCCIGSIHYLERESKIAASTDGTSIGRVSFTKSDWEKWKNWFEIKYNLK